jgi:hypothetical protein
MALGTEFTPLKFEQVNVTTGAQLLTTLSSRPASARHVMMYPEANIRMRADGTAPTQQIGIIMNADLHVFENQTTLLDTMKLISGTGGTVKVNVHWFA